MNMTAVVSENIASVGWEADKLRVRFHDGAEWEYENVSRELYDGLLNAGSKNAYFREHIRGHKPASRIR